MLLISDGAITVNKINSSRYRRFEMIMVHRWGLLSRMVCYYYRSVVACNGHASYWARVAYGVLKHHNFTITRSSSRPRVLFSNSFYSYGSTGFRWCKSTPKSQKETLQHIFLYPLFRASHYVIQHLFTKNGRLDYCIKRRKNIIHT